MYLCLAFSARKSYALGVYGDIRVRSEGERRMLRAGMEFGITGIRRYRKVRCPQNVKIDFLKMAVHSWTRK